jgi:hypothetical protein
MTDATASQAWPTTARGALLCVAGLTTLGFALRVLGVGESLFADELSTAWIVSDNSLGEVISSVRSDDEISPPLFFILAWLSLEVGGEPEWLRLPSLIAGTATIPLIYVVGLRAVGRTAGVLAAAVITLSPFMIYYSTEARAYALMIALLTASTVALLAATRSGRTRWWVLYAVCSCAAVYSHYTSVFPLAAQFAWAAWFHREALRALLLANLGALAGFAVWIPGFIADNNSPTTDILSALEPFSFDQVTSALSQWSVGFPYLELDAAPGAIGWVPIAVGAVVALVAAARRLWPSVRGSSLGAAFGRVPSGVFLVVMLALAAPVGESLYSVFGTDLVGARNLNASWPGLALTLGALISAAGGAWAIVSAALVFSGFAVGAAKTLDPETERPKYEELADWIEDRSSPGDVVVDGVALTPVPLTGLDVYLPQTYPEFRLGLPISDEPFMLGDPIPEIPDQLEQATAQARGRTMFLVVRWPKDPLSEDARRVLSEERQDLVASNVLRDLAVNVQTTDRQTFDGVTPIEVLAIEIPQAGGRGEPRD